MGRTSRKRSTTANRVVASAAALLLGGGGLVMVNVYASAEDGGGGRDGQRQAQNAWQQQAARMSTIVCPEVVNELPEVPEAARGQVNRELAALDTQITEAYERFASSRRQLAQDRNFADNAILNPLKDKRVAVINRIATSIGRVAERPQGLESLAPCSLRQDGNGGGEQPPQEGEQPPPEGEQSPPEGEQPPQEGEQPPPEGEQPPQGNGPEPGDFVDITSVQPNVPRVQNRRGASKGTFTTRCGTNENGKFNPDNVIVAPGVSNGAHHMHDYIGNQANDAFASDDDLANGATTCRNQGDRSTYYWPVLRLQNGVAEDDAQLDGGGKDQNTGEIQRPVQVSLKFVGNPRSKVTAMPRFLRIITGDAKAFVNGDANANASWSCTGFEDRQLKDKYPICPEGSDVVRTFTFQSCWDGVNTDSANHRTHVAFADEQGNCPSGFRAIPQLVQRIVYDVPPGPGFAVDSFPEQLHKPITDHGDFINVFDDQLMKRLATCVNDGRRCA